MSKRSDPLVWLQQFPDLAAMKDDPNCQAWLATAQSLRIAKGSRVYEEGMPCERYLLVTEGSIRVQKVTPDGHEIVLYHIRPGHACELTTACIIGRRSYPAEAVAETAVEAVSLPCQHFDEMVGRCPPFREFVYKHVERGITELVALVEEVAFGHMDARLAHCLLQQANQEHTVASTHQELAAELGSAREVISRLLKEFERHGWVRLHRGQLDILDAGALQKLAAKTFA